MVWTVDNNRFQRVKFHADSAIPISNQLGDCQVRRELYTFTFVLLCFWTQFFNISDEATGQVMLSVADVELSASGSAQTQTFDIMLTHDLPGPLTLTGFQASLSLLGLTDGAPDGSITGVSAPIGQPYVFASESSAPASLIFSDGSSVQAGDFLLTNFADVDSGSILASVEFEIAGGVEAGDRYAIAFDPNPNETFLAGADLEPLDLVTVDGEAVATAVIPEPAPMPFVLFLFVAGLSLPRRRYELCVNQTNH